MMPKDNYNTNADADAENVDCEDEDRDGGSCAFRCDGSVEDSSYVNPVQYCQEVRDTHDAVILERSTPCESLISGGNSTSEASALSPVPSASHQDIRTPGCLSEFQHPPINSSRKLRTPSSNGRGRILGKRRHPQSFHDEFLAYLKESDAAFLAFHETRHKQLLESLQADRDAEAALKAESVRVQETFNNQFLALFGQLVQVLRENQSHTPAQIPLD